MKKTKLLLRALTLALAAMLMLSACGNSNESGGGTNTNSGSAGTESASEGTADESKGEEIELPIEVVEQNISLGDAHSAVITEDGSLYMWGYNSDGQLGNGESGEDKYSSVPVKIMDDVKSVSLGGTHSAAITEDGSLYMWGSNMYGQLGNGESGKDKYSSTPVKVMDKVKSVGLGRYHSAAITGDGSLYMWGWNNSGQLGNGTKENSSTPIKVMDNVKSVSLGNFFSAAITEDGSLYMWGSNSNYGQLGNGTEEDSSTPVKIMDDVKSVSLGDSHSAALTEDGSLYMWGWNRYGQVGNGESGNDKYSRTPVKIMDNVKSVSLGGAFSAALTEDGSLYMWGINSDGELGNKTMENSSVPIKIMDNITLVSLGTIHSAAFTEDGSLYMWGSNKSGRLGNGTEVSSLVPIKIDLPGAVKGTTAK